MLPLVIRALQSERFELGSIIIRSIQIGAVYFAAPVGILSTRKLGCGQENELFSAPIGSS
jgi:hypothetical protein